MPSDKRARQRAAREAKLAEQARHQRRRRLLRNSIVIVIIAAVVIGSVYLITKKSPSTPAKTNTAQTPQQKANAAAVKAGCPSSTSTRVNELTYSAAPPMTIDTSKTYLATVKTDVGSFVITLDAKAAPQTVNNFVFLADKGFYNCVIFHRVIPNFMDQTGDPTGKGTGGPGYTIPDEYPAKAAKPAAQYPVGSVAMANTGQPHSGSSQFFVVTGTQGESLANTYTLFGQVTSGLSVADKINADGDGADNGTPPKVTHRMLSVKISVS